MDADILTQIALESFLWACSVGLLYNKRRERVNKETRSEPHADKYGNEKSEKGEENIMNRVWWAGKGRGLGGGGEKGLQLR